MDRPLLPQRLRHQGRPSGTAYRYRVIASDIERRLASGEWPVGRPIPSISQFAESYGVGTKTIQSAMRILCEDGRVSVRPNRPTVASLGQPLSSMLNGCLAVVMNSGIASACSSGNAQSLWFGISRHAIRISLTVLLLSDDRLWKKEFPVGLRDLPLGGLVLTGPFPQHLLQQYESLGIPTVLLDQSGAGYQFHSVSVANFDAAFDATMRLIKRGHRRVAFARSLVGSLRNIDPDSKERQEGFLAACEKSDLANEDFKVFSFGFHSASPAARELVRSKPPFTAVLCATPDHADQVALEARKAGVKIPSDLSVVTFACQGPRTPEWSGPRIDFEVFGQFGIDLLLRKPDRAMHIRVKTKWFEGNSLSPAR